MVNDDYTIQMLSVPQIGKDGKRVRMFEIVGGGPHPNPAVAKFADFAAFELSSAGLRAASEWLALREIAEEREIPTEEDYTKWSTEKFCQLIQQWREGAHMAGTHDAYLAYKRMLEPAESAFKQLHPRAYQTFEKRFHEQFNPS